MRLFVAAEIGDEVRARLAEATRRLREEAPEAKWVATQSIHLTIAFLGAKDAELAPRIADAVRAVAERHAPVDLGVRGGGSFGPVRRPRVLWVGLQGANDALSALQADLETTLAPLGHEPEQRPFRPHLTLARAREARGDVGLARCVTALAEIDLGTLRIDELVVFESDLKPAGARHTALARAPLGRP